MQMDEKQQQNIFWHFISLQGNLKKHAPKYMEFSSSDDVREINFTIEIKNFTDEFV